MRAHARVRLAGYAVVVAGAVCLAILAAWRLGLLGAPAVPVNNAPYDVSQFRQIAPESLGYREEPPVPLELRFRRVHSVCADADDNVYVVGDRMVMRYLRNPRSTIFVPLMGDAQCLAAVKGLWYVAMRDHVEVGPPNGIMKVWPSPGERANLTSIAVSGKDVFVADAGNRIVWHYDTEGKLLGQIGKADKNKDIEGFVIPSPHFQLAVAPDGLLRVANPGRLCVEAYTLAGDLEWRWGTASVSDDGFSGCCNPASLAIFPDGRIVTAEKGELAMVKIFAPDGPDGTKMQTIVAGPSQFPELRKMGSENAPSVAATSDGTVYVLDPSMIKLRVFVPKAPASKPATAEAKP